MFTLLSLAALACSDPFKGVTGVVAYNIATPTVPGVGFGPLNLDAGGLLDAGFILEGDPACSEATRVDPGPMARSIQLESGAAFGPMGCAAAGSSGPSTLGLALGAALAGLALGSRRRRTWRLRGLLLATVLGAGGCVDPGQDTCFLGVWEGHPLSCDLRCGGTNPPEVCLSSDCQTVSFLSFEEDGTYWIGSYLHSEANRRVAFFAPPEATEWRGTISQGVEMKDPGGEFAPVELVCRSSSITVDQELFTSPPADRAQAVQSALAAGNPGEFTY